MSNKLTYVLLAVFIAAAVVYTSAFVVDETEQVVVTRFGKIVREPLTDPGLNFKLPFFDKVNKFPKNLLFWDGDPGQIPTLEKTYIWVDAFARWRIIDPIKFKQTVDTVFSAQSRLDEIIDPAVRNAVTSYRLIETVRRSNRVLDTFEVGIEKDDAADERIRYVITAGREKIMLGILKQAQPKLDKFGIELVDVKIKRINYVDQVRNSVYNRMIAERKQIAEKFRSEGVGEARKIRGNKERDLKQIESEAYRTAEEVKGKADGQAADIYARAFGVDPEFYSFLKTMEVYRETLSGDSTLVLSTDSDFLGYLKGLPDSIE
ncbi:MAG: protease modulator HflC [Desulfobacteraceae bacterium]|jgi:membrane protease subunit HflC|nr:protease modulator HflC [Desulfobacteraceae bacterium]MBC2750268.1 protease modulator HflC [Desulfobacteraceae bacterium]MEE4602677.1 protease modulator HflC [Desulfobacteraceae bacterium]